MSRITKRKMPNNQFQMGDVFETFINDRKVKGLADVSIDGYRRTYQLFQRMCEMTDESDINEINKFVANMWISAMRDKGYSIPSINHHIAYMRAFIYWCQNEHYIDEIFKIHNIKCQELPPKYLSDEDIDRLLIPPMNDGFVESRQWVMVNLMLSTGFRRATVLNLRIKDINFKERLITASHTKNRRVLQLPISTALYPILKGYITDWRSDADDDDYVFCSIEGQQLTAPSLYQAHKLYCERRGVSSTKIHSMRHSFSRNAILNGMDAFTLKTALGHSNIGQSARYVALWGEDLKEDFNKYSIIDARSRKHQIKKKNSADD